MTRQITRELIIEKLLSLIDLPIIEHLLTIDEKHDIEYCEALERFQAVVLNSASSSLVATANTIGLSGKTNVKDNESLTKANLMISKTSVNFIQRYLSILGSNYDFNKCEVLVNKKNQFN